MIQPSESRRENEGSLNLQKEIQAEPLKEAGGEILHSGSSQN